MFLKTISLIGKFLLNVLLVGFPVQVLTIFMGPKAYLTATDDPNNRIAVIVAIILWIVLAISNTITGFHFEKISQYPSGTLVQFYLLLWVAWVATNLGIYFLYSSMPFYVSSWLWMSMFSFAICFLPLMIINLVTYRLAKNRIK